MFGRQIPADKGPHSLRGFMRYGMAFVFTLGMGSGVNQAHEEAPHSGVELSNTESAHAVQTVESPPSAREMIKEELSFLKSAYPEVSFIPVYQQDMVTLKEDGQGGFSINVNRGLLQKELYNGLSQLGGFDFEGQIHKNPADYFGGSLPEGVSSEVINRSFSEDISLDWSERIYGGLPVARSSSMMMVQENGERKMACMTLFLPEYTTANILFPNRVPLYGRAISPNISATGLQVVMANHEFAHCLLNEKDQEASYKEALPDVYALARYVQTHGEDGSVEKYALLRHLNYMQGDVGHDTTPLLRQAIPLIKELYTNGRMEGLNPKELIELLKNEIPAFSLEGQKQLKNETEQRLNAFKELKGHIKFVGVNGHIEVEEGTNLSEEANKLVADFNTSITSLTGRTANEAPTAEEIQENFKLMVEQVIQAVDPKERVNVLRREIYNISRDQRAVAENPELAGQRLSQSGLPFETEIEIIEGYIASLEQNRETTELLAEPEEGLEVRQG